MQSVGFPALAALLVVVCVIALAICRNPYVRTGLKLGALFSFFLETDRSEQKNDTAPPE
jgi:hypothetical protein